MKEAYEKSPEIFDENFLKKLQEYLEQIPVIRVHFDSVPFGMGNQAASFNLMERLRQLGFKGKFECIYSNGVNKQFEDYIPENKLPTTLKNKLRSLFDLPANFPDIYFDPKTNCEFIESHIFYDQNRQGKIEKQRLAIAGGQLNLCLDIQQTKSKFISEQELYSMNCNNANSLAVDVLLRIQPFLGLDPLSKQPFVNLNFFNNPRPLQLNDLSNLFHYMPISTSFNQVFSDLKDNKAYDNLQKQKPGLISLMQGMKEEKFFTMPFYAWNLKMENSVSRIKSPNYYLYLMTHYLIGLHRAQMTGPEKLRGKGAILPIFFPYMEEIKAIKHFIDPALNKKLSGKLAQVLQKISPNILAGDISDPDITRVINQLSAGQILLVSMGKMPQSIFKVIYREASLPVYEGENTRHLLLSETDKPILRTLSWTYSPRGKGPQKWYPHSKELRNRYQDYDSIDMRNINNILKKAEWITQFITDSLDANSTLSQYFRWLHKEATNPYNDRVLRSLAKLMQVLPPAPKKIESEKQEPKAKSRKKAKQEIELPPASKEKQKNSEPNSEPKSFLDRLEKSFLDYFVKFVEDCPSYYNPLQKTLSSPGRVKSGFFYIDANNSCTPIMNKPLANLEI